MNINAIASAAPTLGATRELKGLKKATQEFEAVFAKKLLSEMRKGVKETSFGDTLGKDMYEDMMDDTISKTMAEQGALGIGKILYKDFAPKVVAIQQMKMRVQAQAQAQRQKPPLDTSPTTKH